MKKMLMSLAGTAAVIVVLGVLSQGKLNTTEYDGEITLDETKFNLEIADTEEERRTGLSNREKLDKDVGILFVFETENIQPGFWMKDMKIPIDIVWINDEKIVGIEKDLQPVKEDVPDNELTLYKPDQPIDYVLEINGGLTEEHEIEVGDSVNLEI